MTPIILSVGALILAVVGMVIKSPSFCAGGLVLMWIAISCIVK